ncbi:hypothetical protein WS105_1310 [Weissella ceti]|jgi:hypothetical protein|uniref:Uncharacterized protein n=2 Tax=Weissella TaxID=46255 RepID=A0A075U1X4_9LACO|nr:hypothetical protein WS08_1245 [Weissella tructae]AIM63565.1 hypothetical protein WS74_1316 [Weissella ceti]AIM64900.1 hypothetical protein WS105_1310 [Weissella ceti]
MTIHSIFKLITTVFLLLMFFVYRDVLILQIIAWSLFVINLLMPTKVWEHLEKKWRN